MIDNGLRIDQTIGIQMRVSFFASCTPDLCVRDLEMVLLPTRVPMLAPFKRPEEVTAPKSALDRTFVNHECILNIIALKREHCDYKVLTCGTAVRPDGGRCECIHHWTLRIMENVSAGIRPQFCVCCGKPDALLNHGSTHRVPWRRVMLRERDHACADSKNQCWLDLKMRVLWRDIRFINSNQRIFFLFSIKILDQTL